MSPISAAIILVTVLATSFLSGIFGMAGGIIFMGVLAALVPVATAMIIHGTVQMVANGYRAYLWREHIDWTIFRRYALGSVAAIGLLFALSWRPDKQMVYLMLGLVTLLVWLPKDLGLLQKGLRRYQVRLWLDWYFLKLLLIEKNS